jgi:hypothetical protein
MTIDKGGLLAVLAVHKSGYTNNRFQRVPSGGGRIVSGGFMALQFLRVTAAAIGGLDAQRRPRPAG